MTLEGFACLLKAHQRERGQCGHACVFVVNLHPPGGFVVQHGGRPHNVRDLGDFTLTKRTCCGCFQVDDAIREMIRCTALARIVHGEGHWKVARAHVTLAAGYFDLKSTHLVLYCVID